MRSIFKYLTRAALAASMVMAVGCAADNADFYIPGNVINPNEGVGSGSNDGNGGLSLADIAVAINTENESFEVTRASAFDEAGGDYLIFIKNEATGEEVYRNTYATTKSLSEPISLPVGTYLLWATSVEKVPATDWDKPQYASMTRRFIIGSDKTTNIEDEVVCTMSNIKTSVSISADLRALFKSDDQIDASKGEFPLEVILTLGDESLAYGSKETRNGFFAVQEEDNTIQVTMRGMYNTAAEDLEPSYAPIEWKQSIPGVTSGQARDVQIEILHYNEGQMEISFKVTSWVYDEVLGVQLAQTFYSSKEDELYDPDSEASDPYSPVITLDGVESGLDYYIYPAAFDDTMLSYTPTYKAIITPQVGSTVASAKFMLSSDNEAATAKIEELGYATTTDIWSDGAANEAMAQYVTMENDPETGVLTASLSYDAMKIFAEYRGVHNIKYIVSDSEGRRSVTNVSLHSVASDKLDIVWRDGYDFLNTYEIAPGEELPVVFDITSMTGLTSMLIHIESIVLTPEELSGLSLAQDMDLINPTSDAMTSSLKTLGFPVGDEILGATELTFNITSFMPILAELSDEGSKDASSFTITVGDVSGECVKILKVVRK